MEYAWFIGKTIVTYCEGILTNSTIYSIDFNNNSEFYSTLDTLTRIDISLEPNNNLKKLQSRLLYIVLGYYGFDIDLGAIKIADDFFSPSLRDSKIIMKSLIPVIVNNYVILSKRYQLSYPC